MKTLKTLDTGELAERAAAGTLQQIPGIGGRRAVSIAEEPLAGDLPTYLATR